MTTAAELRDQVHRRLLNAVISLEDAEKNGSYLEIRAAAVEMEIAKRQSKNFYIQSELMSTQNSNIPGQLALLAADLGYDSIRHLKPAQERFCREYVLNSNNVKGAYLQAYPKSKEQSAIVNGSRLLKTEVIQKRIAEIRQELQYRFSVDAQSVVRLLTMSMNVDRRLFTDSEGKPLELHELDAEAAAITDIEIVIDRHGRKHTKPIIPERMKAAVELAKIMGITREKIEISGDYKGLTDEQLEAESQQVLINIIKENPELIKHLLTQVG